MIYVYLCSFYSHNAGKYNIIAESKDDAVECAKYLVGYAPDRVVMPLRLYPYRCIDAADKSIFEAYDAGPYSWLRLKTAMGNNLALNDRLNLAKNESNKKEKDMTMPCERCIHKDVCGKKLSLIELQKDLRDLENRDNKDSDDFDISVDCKHFSEQETVKGKIKLSLQSPFE